MRELLITYSKSVFKKILALCRLLEQDAHPETIHAIRVELKKVRFLVGRIKFYCPDCGVKKAFKPFKELFNDAGQVRGEHVNEYRTVQSEQGNGSTSEFAPSNKRILKLEGKFRESMPHHSKSVLKGIERLSKKLEMFPSLSPEDFVNDLSAQLRESLTVQTPKRELHHNRHLLKGILYAFEISPGIASLLKREFKKQQNLKLEDAIGDWHDLTILLKKPHSKNKLTSKGLEAARKKKKEKLEFIYQMIASIHQLPTISKRNVEYYGQF